MQRLKQRTNSRIAGYLLALIVGIVLGTSVTAQIANAIEEVLKPRGVAVVIDATHQCMTMRGVHKPGVSMITSRMLGAFRDDAMTRREFLNMIGNPAGPRLF